MILEVQSNTQWLLPRSSDIKEGLEETVSFHKKEIIIFNFFLVNRVAMSLYWRKSVKPPREEKT